MMYSGHDDNISNILKGVVPNYNFTSIPYASTIVFEVHVSSDNGHYIKMIYNGKNIPIDNCEDFKNHGCKSEEFIRAF